MKKRVILLGLILIVLSSLIFGVIAFRNECEHTFDSDCDSIYNECEKTREVTSHEFINADCKKPKTCKNCGMIEGNPLDHIPENDDNDCTTSIKYTECDETLVELTEHDFDGDWQNNETEHWLICQNDGCNKINEKLIIHLKMMIMIV